MLAEDLLERTELRRRAVSGALDDAHRSGLGQFFTPRIVADFLASLLVLPEAGRFTVLDPGAGVGSLAAAVVARVLRERPALDLHVVAFEIDPPLIPHLAATLRDCEQSAVDAGRLITTDFRTADFVSWASAQFDELTDGEPERFSACVMNPPYRKINARSPERRDLERVGLRVSNLYPAFLALAAVLLEPGGQLSAITPRSFANGPYFADFRRFFLDRMALRRLHVFDRRGDVFADAKVLQENVVFHAAKSVAPHSVTLSVSNGYEDEPVIREVDAREVVRPDDPHQFIRIPIDQNATVVAERISNLQASLDEIAVRVSTGRVVDFRAREHLVHDPDPVSTVPLIYPGHLRQGRVEWPLLDGRKPNALERCDATASLLLPAETYVLVKRFTSKEERRRVVASVFRPEDVPTDEVAFENHLNVYHRGGRGLPHLLALGLAAFLNSTVVDDYVRQFSGHTQINATDLRLLRYPSEGQLCELGGGVLERKPECQRDLDQVVSALFDADGDPAEAGVAEDRLIAAC